MDVFAALLQQPVNLLQRIIKRVAELGIPYGSIDPVILQSPGRDLEQLPNFLGSQPFFLLSRCV